MCCLHVVDWNLFVLIEPGARARLHLARLHFYFLLPGGVIVCGCVCACVCACVCVCMFLCSSVYLLCIPLQMYVNMHVYIHTQAMRKNLGDETMKQQRSFLLEVHA